MQGLPHNEPLHTHAVYVYSHNAQACHNSRAQLKTCNEKYQCVLLCLRNSTWTDAGSDRVPFWLRSFFARCHQRFTTTALVYITDSIKCWQSNSKSLLSFLIVSLICEKTIKSQLRTWPWSAGVNVSFLAVHISRMWQYQFEVTHFVAYSRKQTASRFNDAIKSAQTLRMPVSHLPNASLPSKCYQRLQLQQWAWIINEANK